MTFTELFYAIAELQARDRGEGHTLPGPPSGPMAPVPGFRLRLELQDGSRIDPGSVPDGERMRYLADQLIRTFSRP